MRIDAVQRGNIEDLIGLMQDYFDFYRLNIPETSKLESLVTHLLDNPSKGKQFLIFSDDDIGVGFATLYFVMSTLSQAEVVLMNDLFVEKNQRGKGYGKALFDHCVKYTQENGYPKMEWMTEPDNHRARRFYTDRGGKWNEWIYFSLHVDQ